MTSELEQRAQRALVGTLASFFNPRPPFSGKAPPPPIELSNELATQWLASEGKEKAIPILQNGIDGLLTGLYSTRGRLTWSEIDTLCLQALSLYLELADESGIGWVERHANILSYFTELFWRLPDRVVTEREEKTNCVSYLTDDPCMLGSKKCIFSWIVGRWNLRSTYELENANVNAAFDFICAALKGGDSKLRTTEDNIRVLIRQERYAHPSLYASREPRVNEGRMLLQEDVKMFLEVLKRHCGTVKLKEIRPWVRDDLPEKLLGVFQDVLIQSPERPVLLRLLRGEQAAA